MVVNKLGTTFAALSDPTRRAMINRPQPEPIPVWNRSRARHCALASGRVTGIQKVTPKFEFSPYRRLPVKRPHSRNRDFEQENPSELQDCWRLDHLFQQSVNRAAAKKQRKDSRGPQLLARSLDLV